MNNLEPICDCCWCELDMVLPDEALVAERLDFARTKLLELRLVAAATQNPNDRIRAEGWEHVYNLLGRFPPTAA